MQKSSVFSFLFTFTIKNFSEFLVEQRAKSNKQRAKSNEQRAKSNEQRAKSNEQRAESNEQRAESNEQPAKSSASQQLILFTYTPFWKCPGVSSLR